MGRIPDDVLEKIRSRTDIAVIVGEKLPLKRAGRLFKGLCPFHNEKTPSFMVNPERQIFHCFGCGEGGNVFSFLIKFEGLDFVQAVERLGERCGIPVVRDASEGAAAHKEEKEKLFQINRLAARFFYDQLVQSPAGQRARDYLDRRGFRSEMIQEGLLGFAPGAKALTRFLDEKKVPMALAEKLGLVRRGDAGDYYDFFRDRLIFTILNVEGKVLGFSGRSLDEAQEPKYLNSPDSSIYTKGDSLLGLRKARGGIRTADRVIVVEGNFDQLRLFQEGISETVAPLGTALTVRQVQLLARWTRNFVLIFDGDSAGQRAADRALEIFLPLEIFPRVVVLPPGEDPDSFGKSGGEALRHEISVAGFLVDSFIDRVLKEGGNTPEGRGRSVGRIAQVLRLIPGEVEKTLYIQKVAERAGLSEALITREVARPGASVVRTSNLSVNSGDDKSKRGGEPAKLPALERALLEILLSGSISPELLLSEIIGSDFQDPDGAEIWDRLREEFGKSRQVAAAGVFDRLVEGGRARTLLTEITVAAGRWGGEGTDPVRVAGDLVKQIRIGKLKVTLKGLTQEIREAERLQETGRLNELLEHKSDLLRQMKTVH